ncbi:DUF1501 domain-containing protein [Tundrisphaera lichenicola]|uniref:DUF1501 domain-containing protein n=1 Tax=Tundrisphaera lichenicola TaxID=2029860 RepID=UPI003EBDA443
MLNLQGRPFQCCDGVSRRSLLRAGFLGLAGLGLDDLLRTKARAGSRVATGDDLSVILVWLDGGPPQHETYDPKPDAPSAYRGPLGAISTAVPGIQISELLPEHARMMRKMSLIRSVHHDNGDHFAAAHWMLTGYLGSNSQNLTPMYPSAGSLIAKLKGPKRAGMPAYVGLPNTHSVGIKPGYHGGAYLGGAYGPFMADGDPNADGYSVPELTLPGGLDAARLDNRHGLLDAIDAGRHRVETEMDDIDRFSSQAFSMLTGPEARRAFDLSKEDPRLRDRYGRHQWGQSALMARRLVEAGVRFVTLTFGGWDFHSSLDKGMHSVLPVLDHAVATLVEDLDQRGQLEKTMVIVMGEFGRTPKMNTTGVPGSDPVPGRDHWGNVMSVLMAGGGLTPGIVVGSSNARGEVPRERPVTPQDLVATIYSRLGIDPAAAFPDRVNRPIALFPPGGEPIRELL